MPDPSDIKQPKLPTVPVSFKLALEEYANAVFAGGKIDAEVLAALEFDDTPLDSPEAFRLLRDYERLPRGQQLIIDKLFLSGKESIIPAEILDAYLLKGLSGGSDYIALLDGYLLTGSPEELCACALFIRLIDPSDNSLRAICLSVKRTMASVHGNSTISYVRRKRIRQSEATCIDNIQRFLTLHEGHSDLQRIYAGEYLATEYQPTEQDRALNLSSRKDNLNLSVVAELSDKSTDSYHSHDVFFYLVAKALISEELRNIIRGKRFISRIINNLHSPDDFLVLAEKIRVIDDTKLSNEGTAFLNEVCRSLLDGLRKACKQPDFALKAAFCHFSKSDNDELTKSMRNTIRQELRSIAPQKIIDALAKMNTSCLVRTAACLVQDGTLQRLAEYCRPGQFTQRMPDVRFMAFLFKHVTDYLIGSYLNWLTAENSGLKISERRRLKEVVKTALALAGMKEQMDVFDAAVEAAIAKIEESNSRKPDIHAAVTRHKVSKVGVTGDDSESDEDSNGNHGNGNGSKRTRPDTPQAAEPPPKRPGQLDAAEFTAAIKSKLEALNLHPAIASNIGVTKTPNGPVKSKIRADLEETAAAAIGLIKWGDAVEKIIAVEENSILARLGIKAVRFRKTQSFDVEFLFREEREWDEPAPFYAGVHLDDQGVPGSDNFKDEPLLKAIFETEALRQFVRVMMEEDMEGTGNLDVLRLLGLEAMPEPETEPEEVKPKPPANPDGQNDPAPPEPDPKAETRNFIDENWLIFREFMEQIEGTISIKEPFEKLHEIVSRLAAEIQVNKSILNRAIVIMESGHILAPHVQAVTIYSPNQTRDYMQNLKIDPSLVHVDDLSKVDAYLVQLNVKINGVDEEIFACIHLPDYKVYFFGIDPNEIIEDKRSSALALIDLILRAFKMVVMRIDDTEFTRASIPTGKSRRRGAVHVNRIITEATRTSYPPIVTSWQSKHTTGVGGKKSGMTSLDEDDKSGEKIFTQIACSDNLAQGLISADMSMPAGELKRLIPGGLSRLLPSEQYDEYRQHEDSYGDIYVPVRDVAVTNELLDKYRKEKFVETPEHDDWLLDFLRRECPTDANAIAAMDFAFANSNSLGWNVHSYFQKLCKKKFPPQVTNPTTISSQSPYGRLLQQVLAICRQDPAMGAETSPYDVYLALRQVSPVDPHTITIPTRIDNNGAVDYRLPYEFRDGGKDMPIERLFKDGYEVGGDIDIEVVKIIAGNRARLSSTSETWLRGKSRTGKMDWAAKVQSRLSGGQNEVELSPRARALLVWEFLNDAGEKQYAFTYLDDTRDAPDPENPGRKIPAATRLQNFPGISTAARRILIENTTGKHTDFDEPGLWSRSKLLRLEEQGIFTLDRDHNGHILGITPGSVKPIERKKIVIFTGEQVGYRQYQFKPSNFAEYMAYAHREGGLDSSFAYDPKLAKIQQVIYGLLAENKRA